MDLTILRMYKMLVGYLWDVWKTKVFISIRKRE